MKGELTRVVFWLGGGTVGHPGEAVEGIVGIASTGRRGAHNLGLGLVVVKRIAAVDMVTDRRCPLC